MTSYNRYFYTPSATDIPSGNYRFAIAFGFGAIYYLVSDGTNHKTQTIYLFYANGVGDYSDVGSYCDILYDDYVTNTSKFQLDELIVNDLGHRTIQSTWRNPLKPIVGFYFT